ncbi:MAG: hypothetical protein P8182_15980 [Deltaproteobacteria bacterium]
MDVADRCLKLFIFTGILLLLFTGISQAADSKAEVGRLARVSADVSPPDKLRDLDSEPRILPWLENLLTRLPAAEEPADLEEELEQALTESKNEPREPADPSFPRPPSIAPLYTEPALEGEGVWTAEGLPKDPEGRPLIYKTVYRPSADFPNSIVYMALFDMKRLKPRLFIGNTEPGIYQISDPMEDDELSTIVAVTNAMWMQQHARGAGAIFRGQVVYPMVPGMATLVIYRDDSVDVLEWTDEIPLNLVRDARQLRHLIVKAGMVVEQVAKNGTLRDSEIGLGGFLIDKRGSSTMHNKFWFLANRTAFGIRDDGNLIFAMGHHISTKDLAKALVLAGCRRAIHGDANIHNIVCNFYFRDQRDKVIKRDRLSPEQLKYTMNRYDRGYSKDFFAFYEK